MNQANREKVEQIKEIIVTLSDLTAITEIENSLYNNRWRIGGNANLERKSVTEE